jgi:hypothetical protein
MQVSIKVPLAWHGIRLETPAKSGDEASWELSFWLNEAGKDDVVVCCVKSAFSSVRRRDNGRMARTMSVT